MNIRNNQPFYIKSSFFVFKVSYHTFALLFLINLLAHAEDQIPPGSAFHKNSNDHKNQSSFVFTGIVEPGETLKLLLQPGESVQNIFIHEGEKVVKDQPLVQLSNDTLSNAKFDLLQKQNQLKKEKDQLDTTALEIKMKKKQLTRINEEIQTESKLTSEVDGYVSTVRDQLTNQKAVIVNELEILQFKLEQMQGRDKQYQTLHKIITNRLAGIDNRTNNLLIKSPFSGQVTFLSPFTYRTPPGRVVCELWGDRLFRVRGRIMQHQTGQILVGEPVEISLDFSDHPPLTGKVVRIHPSKMVQNDRGGYPTFDVIVEVVSKGQWIEPGMMVSMEKDTK